MLSRTFLENAAGNHCFAVITAGRTVFKIPNDAARDNSMYGPNLRAETVRFAPRAERYAEPRTILASLG
jgi:hypothetical protein